MEGSLRGFDVTPTSLLSRLLGESILLASDTIGLGGTSVGLVFCEVEGRLNVLVFGV